MNTGLSVAIVGATGAVGKEFLRLFESRGFPVGKLTLLASERSTGKTEIFRGKAYRVEAVSKEALQGIDVAFFSAGASRSREFVPAALEAGALVVDNSSAYRTDPAVPLVVPEINADAIGPDNRLVAVPNCSAIILLVAVNPLRKVGTIDRLIVSTYQSASGGGAAMMRLLEDETRAVVNGAELPESPLNTRYAFNLFSHNTAINEFGYNEEEAKVIFESRKILAMPDLKVNITCVRVPVLRAHTESVTVEFAHKAPSIEEIRAVLSTAPGVKLVDDRQANRFPTPLDASGQGEVLVGRIRQDLSNPNAICMLVSGDQLLKGAALNAVQIAESVLGVSRV
ncbi:MAG: aspartate-semialdehyde dehydrogenase [Fimbriimonas sp.]|nr:aspartate-semialdehyde dehydrogenase [Fimbriimonas sp.]